MAALPARPAGPSRARGATRAEVRVRVRGGPPPRWKRGGGPEAGRVPGAGGAGNGSRGNGGLEAMEAMEAAAAVEQAAGRAGEATKSTKSTQPYRYPRSTGGSARQAAAWKGVPRRNGAHGQSTCNRRREPLGIAHFRRRLYGTSAGTRRALLSVAAGTGVGRTASSSPVPAPFRSASGLLGTARYQLLNARKVARSGGGTLDTAR